MNAAKSALKGAAKFTGPVKALNAIVGKAGIKGPGVGALQFASKALGVARFMSMFLSQKQYRSFQLLRDAGISVSAHHPYVLEFSELSIDEQLRAISKIRADEKAIVRLSSFVARLHPQHAFCVNRVDAKHPFDVVEEKWTRV